MKRILVIYIRQVWCRLAEVFTISATKAYCHWLRKRLIFLRNDIFVGSAAVRHQKPEDAQIMFSDFTDLGQDFVMSQQVDKWRGAYSRRKTRNAKPDGRDLDKRLAKFLKDRLNA